MNEDFLDCRLYNVIGVNVRIAILRKHMSNNDPIIGKKLGDYTIESLLGQGGMARVYRGYDSKLDRHAAVKIIEQNLIDSEEEAEYRERFLREARAIAKLNHPRIVSIFQFGQFESSYYMAMGFIAGFDLHQIIKEYNKNSKLMNHSQVLRIIRDVADALDYAHGQGVVHRDVKPSNIMITADGHAVLTDFGLALNSQEGTIGNTFGSVHYIAPEQAVSSAHAVAQSDLYGLGVILFELLTGKVPFEDSSAMSVALKHISDPPPPPSSINPKISEQVEEVILKALIKDPLKRYATGNDFVWALEGAFVSDDEEETHEMDSALAFEMVSSAAKLASKSSSSVTPAISSAETGTMDDVPTLIDTSSIGTGTSSLPFLPSEDEIRKRAHIRVLVWVNLIALMGLISVIVAYNSGILDGFSPSNTPVAMATEVPPTNTVVPPTATDIPPTNTAMPPTATDIPPTNTAMPPTATDIPPTNTAVPPTATDIPPTDTNVPPTNTNIPPTATDIPPTNTDVPPTEILPTTIPAINANSPAEPEILLRYDGRSLIVYNRLPEGDINIRNLIFVQDSDEGEITFDAEEWQNSPSNLRALPSHRCYQVWSFNYTTLPASEFPADICLTRQGFFRTSRPFWIGAELDSTFKVMRGSQTLAECPTAEDDIEVELRCLVDLSP
jgi:serine/threonine protein kinase